MNDPYIKVVCFVVCFRFPFPAAFSGYSNYGRSFVNGPENVWSTDQYNEALPVVLGIQGEGLFIFRDLGRRVIYFQGFGEILGF